MGLIMLAHAFMPIKFRDHSFTSTVHLINRLPTTSLSTFTSPYHALYNTMPDYKTMKPFGCSCFPSLRPYNRHKLQFRSAECVNLGLSPQQEGFKCLSADGRINISKDVIFP